MNRGPAKNASLHGNVPESSPVALLLVDVINAMDFEGAEALVRQAVPMAQRIAALAIFLFVGICAVQASRKLGGTDGLTKLSWAWFAMIVVQIGLGAWTIWSNKAADVATAHVLVGALSLVTGALGCIIAFRRSAKTAPVETENLSSFGALGTAAANK